MKKWIAFVVIFFAAISVKAQYIDGPDRYFYDEEFDWRWDVRVRISDGIRTGYLTNREANRLYKRLERIERKEWAFQSDGYYSVWEQDEIWMDVVALNRAIGLELSDWDRRYYGYTGFVITGPLHWYFGPSYDFHRFDRRGYGSIRVGYLPRNYYPVKHVYYTRRNNYTAHWSHRPNRVVTPSRNNSGNGSRGYSERRTESSRTMAPERASTAGRASRSTAPERAANSERRMESSRATSPERASTSGRVMEPSRSSASERTPSSGRTMESSRSTAPERVSSPARTESPKVESRSTRSSGAVSSGTKSSAAKNSVESRSSSRSSGVSPSNRSARSESSSSAKSSSSRSSTGSRTRN